MANVFCQTTGRLVPPTAVLVHRLHHDPVQLAVNQQAQLPWLHFASGGDRVERVVCAQASAGTRRVLLPDDPHQFVQRCFPQPLFVERRLRRELSGLLD
ncbi:MAG: hypothetical protein AB7F89_18395 [Pirellulaceae bacterium]